MNLKKISQILVLVYSCFCFLNTAVYAETTVDMTMMEKISKVEKFIYGNVQTGALVDRAKRIENEFYGANHQKTTGSLDEQSNYLYEDIFVTKHDMAPSFYLMLNAVERSLLKHINEGAARDRISTMEIQIMGREGQGGLKERLSSLQKVAFGEGKQVIANAILPRDSLIKIKMLTSLDTKTSRSGDKVEYEAASDVYVDNTLVISKGARGTGKVVKSDSAQNFGRDAKLIVDFDNIIAMDSTIIATFLGDKAKKESVSTAEAAGASIAGAVILGPIGLLGGAFVHGSNIKIPEGSEIYIQTRNEVSLFGWQPGQNEDLF